MKKDLNIIEKEVRRCYPKATEEEVARLVREWTAKTKRMNEPDFSLMQFPDSTGRRQTVGRQDTSIITMK